MHEDEDEEVLSAEDEVEILVAEDSGAVDHVVGTKDMEAGTVSIRDRDEGDLGSSSVEEALAKFRQEITNRRIGKTYSGSAGLTDRGATNEY